MEIELETREDLEGTFLGSIGTLGDYTTEVYYDGESEAPYNVAALYTDGTFDYYPAVSLTFEEIKALFFLASNREGVLPTKENEK